MNIKIRPACHRDAVDLADIYNYYIANTVATFETDAITSQQMAERIAEAIATPLPWLIAEASGSVLGYAYATRWKDRCAYRYCVESTIYLDAKHTRKGIGLALYSALIETIKTVSMHSVIGGIALPNRRSVRLHEHLGFEKVGHFKQVGYKHGRWVDVGYWQLTFLD